MNRNLKKEIIHEIYRNGILQLGDFTLKSGKKSPFYIDLRKMISYPELMEKIVRLLEEQLRHDDFDRIAGVPYTGIPPAGLLSVRIQKPLLIPRKEVKTYGSGGDMIGTFQKSDRVVLIDDLITSGESIMETVEKLENHGLEIEKICVLIDRSGGKYHPGLKENYKVSAVLQMEEILREWEASGLLSAKQADGIRAYLSRAEIKQDLYENPVAKKIGELIREKQTNLILSLDVMRQEVFFDILEQTAPYILMVKTHVDILEDFDADFAEKLKNLARKYRFMIFEDRKFADIGKTVQNQFHGGIYKIASWADTVTVHALPGPGILEGLFAGTEGKAGFLLAKMSSRGNMFSENYTRQVFETGKKYPQYVAGYIVHDHSVRRLQFLRSKIPAGQLMLMPGVRLEEREGMLGQQYVPVRTAMEGGVDAVIVGSGILQADHVADAAKKYRDVAWQYYKHK